MAFAPDILSRELPVLDIIKKHGRFMSNIYAMLLWLAMLTSAVTSGYCFIDRLAAKVKISRRMITLIICPLTVPLSRIGFSSLISAIYPVFGYFGLFLVIATLIQGVGIKPGLKVKKSKRRV